MESTLRRGAISFVDQETGKGTYDSVGKGAGVTTGAISSTQVKRDREGFRVLRRQSERRISTALVADGGAAIRL